MRTTLSRMLRMILFLTIPSTIGLVLLREPIVEVLLERGAFGEGSSEATADALLFFSLGLVGHASIEDRCARTLRARRHTQPGHSRGGSPGLELCAERGALWTVRRGGPGAGGLAAAFLNAAMHYRTLRRMLGSLEESQIAGSLWRAAAASLVMAAVVATLWFGPDPVEEVEGSLMEALVLAGVIAVGALAYFGTAFVLRDEEVRALSGQFWRRLFGGRGTQNSL